MSFRDQIFSFIEQKIAHQYDLLALNVSQVSKKKSRFQIVIDRLDGASVTHDDCVTVTRLVEEDLAQKIEEDYTLEVSSPGVDRPLTKSEHFERFVGSKIRFKYDGLKAEGIIKSANKEAFELESGEIISYQRVRDVKLYHK